MNKIILVSGLAGSGKSTLINYLSDKFNKIFLLKKYSTRKIREYEKHETLVDNHFVTENKFNLLNLDCFHIKQGIAYGVSFKELDYILDNGKYPIISSPTSMLIKIDEVYNDLTIKILVKSTIEECRQRIYAQEMTEEQRLLRMSYWNVSRVYEEEFDFDIIIDNNGSYAEFIELINQKLIKYLQLSE